MSTLFPSDLLNEAEALLAELQQRSFRLVTAESCTGGLLAGLITEVPGASASLERGLVTYSNAAKIALLGVDAQLVASPARTAARPRSPWAWSIWRWR
jgi:nicotinamide-nucleotide amidase